MMNSISRSVVGWTATCLLCATFRMSPRQISAMLPSPDQGDLSFNVVSKAALERR